MKPYDPDEARKILQGTLEERIINYAEIKYGKGEEVKEKLYKGGYRNEATDPLEVLDQVGGGKEMVEPEVVKSIDDVVGYKKPNMLKVAVKGTWNLAKKAHVHYLYYPLVGFLPAKYQGKIAEKYGDNPLHYTISNIAAETLAVAGAIAGYSMYSDGKSADRALSLGLSLGVAYGLINLVVRGIASQQNNKKHNVEAAGGFLLISLPIYAILCSIAAVKATKNAIIDSFSSAYKELEQNRETTNILPVRPIPSPPEPSPETAEARFLNTPAIVNPLLIGKETQSRIEKPEILDDEFDEELEDFDQRLRESKRSKE